MAKPAQIIPRHLADNCDDYRRLIDEHFGAVSRKAQNQMRAALERPSNRFWTDILWPALLLDRQGQRLESNFDLAGIGGTPLELRPIYLPISDSVRTKGRNHELAEMASTSDPDSVQAAVALFANALRMGCQDSEGDWEPPSQRVVGARFTVFTLEYDPPSDWDQERRLQFLDTQLGWFRKCGTNDLDRPIRAVWDWAAQFSDFRGISANWSGHKSVHIHLVFDTSALMKEFPLLRDQVRPALTRLWTRMAEEICRVFPQEIEPDTALRLPEQYRKLPNGAYSIETPKGRSEHLLGIPEGTRVPLLCIFEKFLTRAPKGAERAFVNEAVLKQSAVAVSNKTPGYRRRSHVGDMRAAEHKYCSECFNAMMAKLVGSAQFPKGAGLFKESSGWIGRLYANEFDNNPSTIILEDGYRMYVQGGRQPTRFVELPLPLKFLIRKWRREYVRLHGMPSTPTGPANVTPEADTRTQRPEEREFAEAATSIEGARHALKGLLRRVLNSHSRVLIRAPEGLGKTTAIAGCLPELTDRLTASALKEIPADEKPLRDAEQRRPSAFAFSSYDLAMEKALEFNASAAGKTHRGIVFPSFSKLYELCREALGVDEAMTPTAAAKYGHTSVVEAIRTRQPAVWAEMGRRHGQLFEASGAFRGRLKRPVYFVVHQILQHATTNFFSAAFLHRGFFSSEPKDWWQLADEMRLQVAVHDEVPLEAIVAMHPAAQVEWCLNLFETAEEVWREDDIGLVEKFGTVRAKLSNEPLQISFEDVLDIHRTNYRRSNQTEVAGCEAYGNGLLYEGTHGRRWYARKRSWWKGLADRTILLTTEALPTEMLRALDPEEVCFGMFDLRTPELRSGTVQVRLRPSCSSVNAVEIAESLREELGERGIHVISNRVASMEGTSTHAGIRGSNKLTGQNVAQVAFYKPPEEYERLQIINRLFGLSAAIGLRHVDEINQSAGRNLGFRHDGEVQHHLIVGWSLYEQIEAVLYRECRYDLTLVADADSRRKARSTQLRAQNRDLIQQKAQIEANGLE